MSILVVCDLSRAQIRPALSAVRFAVDAGKALGVPFSILLIGAGARVHATAFTAFGAAKVLVADDPSYANYVTETFFPVVVDAAKKVGATVVVGTATIAGKDLLPRVAHAFGAGYAADIASFRIEGGKLQVRRPIFAGNALAWVGFASQVAVVSVRQTEFAAADATGGSSPVEAFAAPADAIAARVEVLGFDEVKLERPDLSEAKIIVSGGRGLKERFMELLAPLADTLGAAIGATRAACDAGFAPPDLQVGQTGKMVAPEIYFAFGISGAIQHVAGMKSSKVIVAVNKDPEAPIHSIADYSMVADATVVIPELTKRIGAHKGG
jgi:electron transfer flavoprotein alpha subunit